MLLLRSLEIILFLISYWQKERISLIIKHVKYIGSFVDFRKLPSTSFPEFAFIGRSNVGKSSLINAICKRKELAKVSKPVHKLNV